MSINDRSAPIAKQKAQQRLRQEQETFDQKKAQDARWFVLRLVMGILAILIIPTVMVVCVLIIFDPHQSETVKSMAASALLVDILGLVGALWRVILNPGSVTQLEPVTGDGADKPGPVSKESSAQTSDGNSKQK